MSIIYRDTALPFSLQATTISAFVESFGDKRKKLDGAYGEGAKEDNEVRDVVFL